MLRIAALFNDEEFKDLRSRKPKMVYRREMNEEGIDGLLTWWNQQPRHRRNNIELKISLIQRLIDCNDHESATELTFEILKKLGDNTAISLPPLYSNYTFTTEKITVNFKLHRKRANVWMKNKMLYQSCFGLFICS